MKKQTFKIDYKIVYPFVTTETKTMFVKDCMNEDHAKLRLDKYIKKKYDDVVKVVVVDIKEENTKIEWLKYMFGFNVAR